MNKKKSIIGGAIALLAGIPALINAIGYTITGICIALLIGLAVLLVRKVGE